MAGTLFGFFQLLQQTVNVISIMAIGIERMYSIYFPLHAYKTNSFKIMAKISLLIIVWSFL